MILISSLILMVGTSLALSVRDNNGGNCVGVKSCRPRCATFRLDRQESCDASAGIFALQSQLNPWDTKRFRVRNCDATDSCVNDKCGQGLSGDLTVKIGEQGYIGGIYYTKIDLPASDDSFTFCSIYPCTKDECALPEQMGFELEFSFFEGSVNLNEIADPLMVLEFYLKASFVGQVLQRNSSNHYGPLHVEWLDDPTNCRPNEFSAYAPFAPIEYPVVLATTSISNPLLYCEGDEYLPSSLPQTRAPTHAPSASPSLSIAPSASPSLAPSSFPSANPTHSPTVRPTYAPTQTPTASPTFSAISLTQIDALANFYNVTQMYSSYSSALQNWFVSNEYCNFTGVACDGSGYVISIELVNKGLAGTLPTIWNNLNRLVKLKITGNVIGGPIPSSLFALDALSVMEMGSNRLTGEIPSDLNRLQNLRRLFLADNKLTGTIPRELCDITKLTAFSIAGNVDMTGEIPLCFGGLPLDIFRVDNVGLVGSVPASLCGIRSMNMLNPNRFGCDALACPAGTRGAVTGRMTDNGTPCIPCSVPSNVIGSTTCVYLDDNTGVTSESVAPSVVSPLTPTMFPSSAIKVPSGAPLVDTTTSPSMWNISVDDTSSPTYLPSAFPSTATPSSAPSSSPSIVSSPIPTTSPSATSTINATTLQNVELNLVFVGVTSKLNDTASFIAITKRFLTFNSTKITNIKVISQSVDSYTNATVVSIASRYLESTALHVRVKVEGRTDQGSLADAVQSRLLNFDAYKANLGFGKTSDQPLAVPPPQPSTLGNGTNKKLNWGLIGAAICLVVVAAACVYIVRYNQTTRLTQQAHDATIGIHYPPPAQEEDDNASRASGIRSAYSLGGRDDDNSSVWDEWSAVDLYTKKPNHGLEAVL